MSRSEGNPKERLSVRPAGHGRPLDINTGVLRHNRMLLQTTKAGELYIGLGERTVLIDRLSQAGHLLKDGFDPAQPRGEDGRWATSGVSPSSLPLKDRDIGRPSFLPAAAATAMAIPQSLEGTLPDWPSIFSSIGAVTRGAVGAFVDALEGTLVAFNAWFVPLRDGAAGTADLPGTSDVHYHYDEDAGKFTVWTSDHETLFEGTVDAQGMIRDEDGNVIGQHVNGGLGGGLVIDTTKLSLGKEKQESVPVTGALVQARAETDTQDKLCPDPLPDIPGFRSARSLAYQGYINAIVNPAAPLPPNLAIYLLNPTTERPVAYDNCYQQNGTMVDAKGPGYAKLLKNKFASQFVDLKFIKQANRQLEASGTRQIIWYVDEPEVTKHLRVLFASKALKAKGYDRISIVDMPMPDEMRKYLFLDEDDSSIHFDILSENLR